MNNTLLCPYLVLINKQLGTSNYKNHPNPLIADNRYTNGLLGNSKKHDCFKLQPNIYEVEDLKITTKMATVLVL